MKEIIKIRKLIKDLEGQIAPAQFTEEELVPTYDNDDFEDRTFAIEPEGSVYHTEITDFSASEFSFFQDAKQRTVQVGFLPIKRGNLTQIIPIHFYVIGVVILKRIDKKLSVWNSPIIETGLVVHKKALTESAKSSIYENIGVSILDTSEYDLEGNSNDYYRAKEWALQAVKKRKQQVEQNLIESWRTQTTSNSFLVVDGSLINLRGEENIKRCIGLSKSSRMKMDNYDKIMHLKEFERSWVFSFHSDDSSDNKSIGVRDRISWYIRLRNHSNNDPEFGLLRAEMHPSYKSSAIALAERFSKSILLERFPTSHPANNWDRSLYPIAVCNNYLNSIMPSIRTIKAAIKL